MLERLSWPDTRESRDTIEGAVERYYSAAYRRTSTEPMGVGGGERRSSQVQKLVPAYEMTLELPAGHQGEVRKSTVVQFMPKLIEEVAGTEKYFLGVDFERLGQLERITAEDTVANSCD